MKDAGCHGNGACATQDNVRAVVQGSVLNIDLRFPGFLGSAGLCAWCSNLARQSSSSAGLGPGEFPPLSRAGGGRGRECRKSWGG